MKFIDKIGDLLFGRWGGNMADIVFDRLEDMMAIEKAQEAERKEERMMLAQAGGKMPKKEEPTKRPKRKLDL